MKRTVLKPAGVHEPGGFYSHGVVVEAGRTLYLAGQVALDKEGRLVGKGDPLAQARQALANMKKIIEEAGGRMEDIAKMTTYVTDRAFRGAVGEARKEFFPGDPPGHTFLVISGLANPDFLVEIEAVVPLP